MSDGELVRRALDGDGKAGDQLVRSWQARLVGLCHAKTGRADVAEELAQESMFRAIRGLRTLAEPDKFAAWLRGIAVRVCVDWIRAKKRAVPFSVLSPATSNGQAGDSHDGHVNKVEDSFACPQPGADRIVEKKEQHARLWDAIGRLPEAFREVIMIYYYDGETQTYARVAEMLGVSSATINMRLTKARARLRADLASVGKKVSKTLETEG